MTFSAINKPKIRVILPNFARLTITLFISVGTFDVGDGNYFGKQVTFHNLGYFVAPQSQHLPIDANNAMNFTNIRKLSLLNGTVSK